MSVFTGVEFPPFRLDLANEQFWHGAEIVPLRPKTFAVLRYLVDAKSFWKEKVGENLRNAPHVPARCRALLERALPQGARKIRIHSRVAGVGSLGRPRTRSIR